MRSIDNVNLILFSFILFFLVTTLNCIGQTKKIFFDKQGREIDSAHSYYYQIRQKSTIDSLANSFYTSSGKTRHIEDWVDQVMYVKHVKYFYENGQLMSEGDEIRFWPIGRVVSYYSNGKQKSELTFNRDNGWADPLSGLLILNYWDESGKQLVNEGNGNCRCELMPYSFNSLIEIGYVENGLRNSWWKIESTDGSVREELYEKGDFKKGIIKEKNGSLYSYVNFEQISQPVGGMAKFYAVISKSLRYPKEARRNRIEGKVFVQFIIERDGTISNPKVIKGLGFGCDEAAIKAIQKSPKWIPGTQRGKPVTQRYTLPIQFKLG